MRFRRSCVLAVVIGVLSGFPGAASAVIRDASEAPRTSGPLIATNEACGEDESSPMGGLRTQTCVWTFVAPAETEASEDFTSYWVQIEAEPARDWCVLGLGFDSTGPDVGRIVTGVPGSGKTGGKTTVELVVAAGAAVTPGAVAQDLVQPKGRVRTTLDPDLFTYRWKGRSSKKVVVAMGLQLAYPVPPPVITQWIEGTHFYYGACRPGVIRSGR